MATATPILVSLSEYLRTGDYEPDAEYVDGVLEERPVGELDHSSLQGTLFSLLSVKATRPYFRCYPELLVHFSPPASGSRISASSALEPQKSRSSKCLLFSALKFSPRKTQSLVP